MVITEPNELAIFGGTYALTVRCRM